MREEDFDVSFESIYSKHSECDIKESLIVEQKKTWTSTLYAIFCCCCFL